MANGFDIQQVEAGRWDAINKVYLYRFNVRHDLGLLDVTVGVDQNALAPDGLEEAKKNF